MQSFFLKPVVVSLLCLGRSSNVNKQRAITQKLGNAELRFLCTALLLNEINIPAEFLFYISCSFGVMFQTMLKV